MLRTLRPFHSDSLSTLSAQVLRTCTSHGASADAKQQRSECCSCQRGECVCNAPPCGVMTLCLSAVGDAAASSRGLETKRPLARKPWQSKGPPACGELLHARSCQARGSVRLVSVFMVGRR